MSQHVKAIPVAIAHNKTTGAVAFLQSEHALRVTQREWLEANPKADIDVYVPQNTPSLQPTDNMRIRARARGEDRLRRHKEQQEKCKADEARRKIEWLRSEMAEALAVLGECPEPAKTTEQS